MNNLIFGLLLIILILLIIIILKKNKASETDVSRQNEILLKLLDTKLKGQNQLLSQATINQSKILDEKITNVDANMQRTNKQIENVIRHMFTDLETKNEARTKRETDQSVKFEKQLVKVASLDESLSSLEERIVDLSMILNNSKARGTFGEIQLYQLIDNQFGVQSDVISKQDKLSTGVIVDLSIASNSLGQKICIDSKFPLENYLEYRETGEQGFKTLFERDIKRHIDDITTKYIIGGETVNFAIMFIPSEAIYLEIMENTKLVDYSYKRKVWLASPTTLIALITMLENINTDYKRMENLTLIESELDKLNVEFDRFNKRYANLSRHMMQVINDFEEITITQRKLSTRFESIKKMEMEGVEDE